MKLKKAIKIVKKLGYKWVAVDNDGTCCAYSKKPHSYGGMWWPAHESSYKCVGVYTGSKNWEDTLRRVK